MRRAQRFAVCFSALTLSVVLAGCDGSESDDPEDPDQMAKPTQGQLVLHFDDDPAADITNSGSGDFEIDTVTQDGGSVESGEAADGDEGGLRTPEFADSPDGPKAIIKVVNASDDDELNPGTSDFTIGADVNVDPNSESDISANGDNGNNVMQRGLFEGSQYKLQIDHKTASCRVKGAEGEVTVKSSVEIEDGHWYRLRCTRSGNDVTFSVSDMQADDSTAIEDKKSGATGSLDPVDASLPLSVGGKLNADGGIVADSTDQFNGLLDNILLDIQ